MLGLPLAARQLLIQSSHSNARARCPTVLEPRDMERGGGGGREGERARIYYFMYSRGVT